MRRYILMLVLMVAMPAMLSAQWVALPGDEGLSDRVYGLKEYAASFERHRIKGNVKSITAEIDGERTCYSFTPQGDVSSMYFYDADGALKASSLLEYSYDEEGMRRVCYDIDGDMIYAFCFDHMGDVIAYGYDYQGRRDCLEVEYDGFGYPSIVSTRCGSEDVKSTYLRYDYDMAADGRILRVEVMGECNYTAHYYYDDAKRLRQATKMERYSDDIMTLVKSYDVDGNLVRLELLDGVEVMYCLMYDYSAPDTLERVVREVSGMVDYFDNYLYSEGGRGLVVTRRGIYGEEYQRVEFEFDGVGNITKMVTTPGRYSDVDVVTFDIEYYE